VSAVPTGALGSVVPGVPETWVERAHLMARLDDALRLPLTLLVAPAGAGKTVTMARWALTRADAPVRWRAGRRIRAARGLAEELVDAARARPLAAPSAAESAEDLAEAVADRLQGCRAQEIVVVDDAHRLPRDCYVLLDALLGRCPEALRLVLLSRWDPPLQLLAPAVRGHLSVVGGDQLRLSGVEARALLVRRVGGSPRGRLDTLVGLARGWAAVLVLAAESLRAGATDGPDAWEGAAARGFGLADLLATEVYDSLDEQQRHVLLCVSGQDGVTLPEACRLSGDPSAATVLHDLAAIGLLVDREPPTPESAGAAVYRLHPLLVEVLRRRFHLGGPELPRVRAALLEAARLDVVHGRSAPALRRMLWVHAFEEAAALVEAEGLALVAAGHGHLLGELADAAPALVARRARTWLPLAVHARRRGDHPGTQHWSEQVLRLSAEQWPTGGPLDGYDRAVARLLMAGTGGDDVESAVEDATELVALRPVPLSYARRALLLVELGAAETWLGRLEAATEHLTTAVAMCRDAGYPHALADALSLLGLVELMRGRPLAALAAAQEALTEVSATPQAVARWRGDLVVALARRDTLPEAAAPTRDTVPWPEPGQEADPASRVFHRIRAARHAAQQGDGRPELDQGSRVPLPPSRHLAVRLDLERVASAVATGDVVGIRALQEHLARLGADAESACLGAVLADMDADLARADRLLAPVVEGVLRPVCDFELSVVLVLAAQVADARGDRDRADRLLLRVVRTTAPQRYAVPFLGWSCRGTAVPVLLARLRDLEDSAWAAELRVALEVAPAGRHERPAPAVRRQPPVPARPRTPARTVLTRREQDVLFELSHGSSYADIAETLIVTENTVKTHVSSLYAKLGARRRSHALRTARERGLI
jgi:LuxR family transcriptional regulator, maltose regulon positive regulatory protein